MPNLYPFAKHLLFQLPAETSHELTLSALQQLSKLGKLNPLQQHLPNKPCSVMGIQFPSPIGLAAGLDKNGDCITGLAALGFGFVEIGTLTPRPQPGNPQPRMFRIPQAEALINRMGFNNKGVDYALDNIRNSSYRGILGINIGKNFDTPIATAVDDYLIGLKKVYPYADYITVNISSPNTPGLRQLQEGDHFSNLLSALQQERQRLIEQHQKTVPIAVKIAPDCSAEQLANIAAALLEYQLDAIIATNTTASRDGVDGLPYAEEAGGLSGDPLFNKSLATVSNLKTLLSDQIPIIGCGGINNPQRALQMLEAGASLLQIYSGLIYQGPQLIKQIHQALS